MSKGYFVDSFKILKEDEAERKSIMSAGNYAAQVISLILQQRVGFEHSLPVGYTRR